MTAKPGAPPCLGHQPAQAGARGLSLFNSWCMSWFSFGNGSSSALLSSNHGRQRRLKSKVKADLLLLDAEAELEMMHQLGDSGRIANRFQDDHWDVW